MRFFEGTNSTFDTAQIRDYLWLFRRVVSVGRPFIYENQWIVRSDSNCWCDLGSIENVSFTCLAI